MLFVTLVACKQKAAEEQPNQGLAVFLLGKVAERNGRKHGDLPAVLLGRELRSVFSSKNDRPSRQELWQHAKAT
jgi:hypothetical protein